MGLKIGEFFNKHSGPILTAGSILSFSVALWRMYVVSPRIHDILDDAKEDWHDARTTDERKRIFKGAVKDIAIEAAPIGLSYGLGAGMAICNQTKNSHEIDKYAFLWTTEKSLASRYRKAVKEEVGENKEREIHDKAVSSYVRDPQNAIGIQSLGVTDEDWIIFDTVSKQYFPSNKSKVMMALSKINMRNMSEHFIEYADFLLDVGGDISKVPDDLYIKGWDLDDGPIEPVWTTTEMEGSGRPIAVLSFNVEPKNPKRHIYD